MKKIEALDFILKDQSCLDLVKRLEPINLLKTLVSLGLLKDKTQMRDIILKVNEHVWLEPVNTNHFPPDPKKNAGDWPYNGQNVEFMKRKRTAKQGMTT